MTDFSAVVRGAGQGLLEVGRQFKQQVVGDAAPPPKSQGDRLRLTSFPAAPVPASPPIEVRDKKLNVGTIQHLVVGTDGQVQTLRMTLDKQALADLIVKRAGVIANAKVSYPDGNTAQLTGQLWGMDLKVNLGLGVTRDGFVSLEVKSGKVGYVSAAWLVCNRLFAAFPEDQKKSGQVRKEDAYHVSLDPSALLDQAGVNLRRDVDNRIPAKLKLRLSSLSLTPTGIQVVGGK